MSGGGALNLSLLSRGIGEVQKNGHEKVEVFLEPSDYFNFGADRPYYLPPIHHQSYHFTETSPRFSTRSSRDGSEIPLPKTFTTRKGALLLFSEDMAMKTNEKEHVRKPARHRHHSFQSSFSPHGSFNEDETAIVLKTVDDLAKSILQYGASRHSYDDDDDKMYLKFIHRRREQWERQIRPGYSAKRYLSTWTRNWDDQVFETVVSKGYLTERSLFHYNLFLPHLRRHLFHEDLSNMPQPYRLMKNMLLSPGSLSGYTFYRAADFGVLMEEDEDGADGQKIKRPDTKRSIRVIRTNKEGVQKEVSYSALDKDTQKEVITDLLVKSAVHYALSKQEEIIEESLAQAMQQSEHGGESSATTYELSVTRKTPDKGMPGFDMRDAVDSLLNTQRSTGPYVLGGDLPEAVDAHSHSSEHTGSFKGGAVPQHAVKAMGARQTPKSNLSTPMEAGGGGNGGGKDKEFMGDLPVAAVRDVSASSSQSQHSSVPQLPPITRHTLSPIRDVSRETSQLVTLPPIFKDGQEELKQSDNDMPTVQVVPPTPQLSNMSMPTTRSEPQQRELQKVIETEAVVESEPAEYHASSDSTPSESAPIPTHRTGRTSKSKTSKGPKVSHGGRSMAGGSGESKSMKGSMIMAPDGEIISVGGSVSRPHDVGMISDVTLQQRQFEVNITDESGLSDDEPDEWRAASKLRKPRTMSSKLSESLKRSVGKRESETSVGSGTKSVVSSGKEEKEAGSGPSMIIKKSSVVSKEIDYTSGDIDATMSIHSWSYAPKGEEGEYGLVKAGSKASLLGPDGEHTYGEGHTSEDDERWTRITERPEEEEVVTLSREPTLEVVQQGDYLTPHKDHTPASQQSSSHPSPGEHFIAPEDDAASQGSHVTPKDRHHGSGSNGPRSSEHTPRDKGPLPRSSEHTPRDKGPLPRSSEHTPRDKGPLPRSSEHTPRDKGPKSSEHSPRDKSPGDEGQLSSKPTPREERSAASKQATPGPASKHTTPGASPKQTTPRQSKHSTPGNSRTPGNMLGAEIVPIGSGPRPTPASVALTLSEDDSDDDNKDAAGGSKDGETARSRSVALQTDSATSGPHTPRAHSTSNSHVESGRESGEEAEEAGEEQWAGGKETLDVVPEESQKDSAAPSRIQSSIADKHTKSALSRSETADGSGKPESKADSTKAESIAESQQGSHSSAKKGERQGSSGTAENSESRQGSSTTKGAESRQGSGSTVKDAQSRQGSSGTAKDAQSRQGSSKSVRNAESRQGSSKAAKSRATSSRRGASRTSSAALDHPHGEPSVIREETNLTEYGAPSTVSENQNEREGTVTTLIDNEEENEEEDADYVSGEPVSSRTEKVSSKTGPSPRTESKGPSKAGSRVSSTQHSKHSNESGIKSSALSSENMDSPASGQTSTQKPRGSAKEDTPLSAGGKTSQRSQVKSQAKDGARAVSTRLSEPRMTTPPHGGVPASQWDEDAPEPSEHGTDVPIEDDRAPSTVSTALEGASKVSSSDPPNRALDLSVEGTQLLTPAESPSYGHRTRMTVPESVVEEAAGSEIASQTGRSSVTEQDILDTLTEHAKMIADSVLSNKQAGQDLEEDVRHAADKWMESHPTQSISRSHSVQDALKAGAVDEIMKARRASSAGPSTDEYKDLIRQSLTTAVVKAAGLDPEQVPEDAEISPDLLDALASQKLSPDDIAIVHDEETGRAVIKSRQEITQALGGVAEGHIYVAPNGKGGSIAGSDVGIRRQMSIPADRASLVDNMDYDVISYGGTEIMSERGRPAGRSKAGSKPGSLVGGTVADLKDHSIDPAKVSGGSSPEAEQDEFAQRLQQLEKNKDVGDEKPPSLKSSSKGGETTPALPGDSSPKMQLDLDRQSEKSAKTGVSQKTDKSDESKKEKVKTPEEPFVVGKTDEKGKLEKLYGPVEQPPKKKDKGKAVEKSPELSPRQPVKSPGHSGKTEVPKEKSPRQKEKSPRQPEKPATKTAKTPRPEPAGEEAPEAKPKEEKASKRGQRQKKEKTANPRRGSRALEAELKAREEKEKEKEKESSVLEKEEEIKPQEEEVKPVESKPVEVEQKAPEEPPPSTKPAEKVDTEPAAKRSANGKASPRAQEGLVDHKAELSKLYGAQGPGTLPKTETKSPVKGKKPKKDDKKDKSKKKGTKPKKKGKKEEEPTPEVVEEPPAPEPPAPEPVVETKKPTPQPTPREPPEPPKPLTASSSERPFLSSPELTRTDDEMEFTIVREESSPEPEQPQKFTIPPPFPEEEEDIEEEEEEVADDPGEDSNLKSISNREARAAKRAAAAAKRKEEVEKRRREREEQLKREKEEQERQEQLKKEMETERKRREEERRLRKQQEAEEADKEERARQEAERKKRQAEERERRAKEEYQRKLEEMRRKQIEEEAKRMELLLQKQKEEEERRAEEELLMSQMAEQERLEYEKKKKEEEEERKRLEEEERRKREEEAKKAMEEARRLAEEMARKQAELEARLKFNRALQVEASGLDHSHDINRAFVFSYFELLQWLGLDIPEFELSKITQPL